MATNDAAILAMPMPGCKAGRAGSRREGCDIQDHAQAWVTLIQINPPAARQAPPRAANIEKGIP